MIFLSSFAGQRNFCLLAEEFSFILLPNVSATEVIKCILEFLFPRPFSTFNTAGILLCLYLVDLLALDTCLPSKYTNPSVPFSFLGNPTFLCCSIMR